MDIPPYKIHNVLKVYAKRLIRAGESEQDSSRAARERRRLANENRLQAVINKISENIIRKAGELTSEKDQVGEAVARWQTSPESQTGAQDESFVYYIVEPDNRTVCRTLSLDEATFLSQDVEKPEES